MSDLVRQLRERVEELEEEIRQLRADMVQTDTHFMGILTRQESIVMRGILSRKIASYVYLDQLTMESCRLGRYGEEVNMRVRCKVAIYKIRNKLKPYGIEIKTWIGVGYYLDDENKAKLKQLMEKKDG
jgi:hypothetical protein